MHEPGSLGQLERALEMVGLRLDHVRLLVCTHAHADHCGQATAIVERAGCELWMHPNHLHMTAQASDPEQALARRVEVARQSGVPAEPLRRWAERRAGQSLGIVGTPVPDRDLLPGMTIDSDLGPWSVHETPGHAPSHVCLHQADRRLLLSGDQLLGRVSLYFDHGFSPDPVGEFMGSLDAVEALGARLCLSGHGRPFSDVRATSRRTARSSASGCTRSGSPSARRPPRPTSSPSASTGRCSRRTPRAGCSPSCSATSPTSSWSVKPSGWTGSPERWTAR
jgi:glyoxylase-like metal-dependent hydrolase (beta-lactamase superfamily II)